MKKNFGLIGGIPSVFAQKIFRDNAQDENVTIEGHIIKTKEKMNDEQRSQAAGLYSILASSSEVLHGGSIQNVEPLIVTSSQKEAIYKANGLKPFEIEGETIWAINEKNAQRKFKKLKL
jgi:hypothetical protein